MDRDPQHNRFWWPVTNSNILYLNMSKAPFNDTAFRRAMGYAINKDPLSEKAYYGVVPPSPIQRASFPVSRLTGLTHHWLTSPTATIQLS